MTGTSHQLPMYGWHPGEFADPRVMTFPKHIYATTYIEFQAGQKKGKAKGLGEPQLGGEQTG